MGLTAPLRPVLRQDLQLFQEAGGWDVVSAVAEFWCSRVEWSPAEEKYHLKGAGVREGGWSWGRAGGAPWFCSACDLWCLRRPAPTGLWHRAGL